MIKNVSVKTLETILMEKKKKWMYVAFEQSLILPPINESTSKKNNNNQKIYTNPGGERLNPQPYLN